MAYRKTKRIYGYPPAALTATPRGLRRRITMEINPATGKQEPVAFGDEEMKGTTNGTWADALGAEGKIKFFSPQRFNVEAVGALAGTATITGGEGTTATGTGYWTKGPNGTYVWVDASGVKSTPVSPDQFVQQSGTVDYTRSNYTLTADQLRRYNLARGFFNGSSGRAKLGDADLVPFEFSVDGGRSWRVPYVDGGVDGMHDTSKVYVVRSYKKTTKTLYTQSYKGAEVQYKGPGVEIVKAAGTVINLVGKAIATVVEEACKLVNGGLGQTVLSFTDPTGGNVVSKTARDVCGKYNPQMALMPPSGDWTMPLLLGGGLLALVLIARK